MTLFSAGTLLLIPGLRSGQYSIVLCGFLLIGIGFNFQLVAGNPLMTALGPAAEASSRLNLGNALGAVAQIIAPATLAFLVPASAATVRDKLPYIEKIFLALGLVLAAVVVVTIAAKSVDPSGSFQKGAVEKNSGSLLTEHRAVWGFVAIFLILGFEAGLFGFYRNFLEDPGIAGFSARQSQLMFTVYFAVFALGRLVASWVQRRIRPATHLQMHLAGAMACLLGAVFLKGLAAAAAVTAIGFFVSILFPTLYSIAIRNMGERTGPVSGLLTTGFVGCALIPVLQGRLADSVGLQPSYAVGFLAYLFAAWYAFRYRES
jgi:FHS family L-fucose permease-like MFS transporter